MLTTSIADRNGRAAPSKNPGRNGRPKAKSRHVSIRGINQIAPSPENAKLYRPITRDDPEIRALAESIRREGIKEPLLVTQDGWIISGHRRYLAAQIAGLVEVPCQVELFRKEEDHQRFMRLLRDCNRQRVKSFDEKLREEVLAANPEKEYQALLEHREQAAQTFGDCIALRGKKMRARISDAKMPFLLAIKRIIQSRKPFWPLSDRQIHYALLNDTPLIHASKPDSRYRNNKKSYQSLTDLLTRARLEGHIAMTVIADETRPVTIWNVHADVTTFIRGELDGFLKGYWRDLLQSQPNHIEIIGEKNTIGGIIRPIASQYCIPVTLGRGYCSLRPRADVAERFEKNGKERLVLLILSDFDPDGEEIARSFARSLRDDFGIDNIDPIKVALTAEQVDELNLPPIMQAKTGGTNYAKFSRKYGETVYELEAVTPEKLQDILEDAIESVVDRDALNHEIEQEKADATHLAGTRRIVHEALGGLSLENEADE